MGALLVSAAAVLALVKIEDTDAWTHLALGRAIVQARGFPATEQFNFPSLDLPYYNSEWLFGVVLYGLHALGGIPAIVLFKALVVGLVFAILFRDALLPRDGRGREALGTALAVLVLVACLLMARHRFVDRPDLVLMAFLAFTIHALNAFVHEGRRYLYALPPLQLLWVNMHPSIIVGVVPFAAVLAGGIAQRGLGRWRGVAWPGTPSWAQLRTIAVVFAGVLAASLVNPYGVGPFLLPFRMAGSAWLRHEILELQPPRLPLEPAPFVVIAVLVLVFAATVRRLSIVSVLLVVPFVYLALSARRFVFLLAIVAAPVIARHVRALVRPLRGRWAVRLAAPAAALAAITVVVVTGLTLARVPPFVSPPKITGLGINDDPIPEGALRYLDRIGVTGRVFNAFQWGGYIVWRDFPRRVPFVDGRGHVRPELLEELSRARMVPTHMARLAERYAFDVAVVNYPSDKGMSEDQVPDIDLALTSPQWALVYWDDLALVYLRRSERLAAVIARDEYRLVKPANGAVALQRKLTDAARVAAVEAELRRNVAETGSSVGFALLGFVHNETGAHAQAIEALSRVRDFPLGSHLYNAYQGLAFAHVRLGDYARAIGYYEKALRIDEDPNVLYNLGVASAKLGRDREAITHLERAVAKDRRLIAAYSALIAAYRRTGRDDLATALGERVPAAVVHREAEERFKEGLRFYMAGDYHAAAREFRHSIRLNPRNPSPQSNLGYLYFDLGRLDEALAAQRAALAIDPEFATAHYGAALVYLKRGQTGDARAHFEHYLRLDPSGYWARRAREELTRLRGS